MDTSMIRGIIPPILTPIDQNEQVDEAKMRKQVEFVINGGVHGILAFGSNGEFYMLEEDETQRALEIMLSQAAGRVPVYCGIGAIRTQKCIRLARMARKAGAAGISVLQPMFLKPTEEELFRHFAAIAESVPDLPMLLYNNPGRTGYTMSYSLVERLAERCPNIVGMKDSSGDMTRTAEFIRRMRGREFKVFGGKDTLVFSTLIHGGAGGVCSTANMYPELVCSIYEKFIAGDIQGSLEAQFRLNPVRLSMDLASFPVATKDMANMMGLDVGAPFLPSLPSDEKTMAAMRKEMIGAGLLKA
ncbi:MAG: dihydrodipicolinate synthase family protein [Clostridia bacterium]|nr:dihydrodipicolinate synthase family protein [Clostridia bacterium]